MFRRTSFSGDPDAEIEELRELFKRHGLLPDVPTPDPGLGERVLTRILNSPQVAYTPISTQQQPAASELGRRFRRFTLAVAAAVALIAATGIQFMRAAPSSAMAGTPAPLAYSLAEPADFASALPAHDALRAIASAASEASGADDEAESGSVQYVSSFGWYFETARSGSATTIVPIEDQSWLAADGSTRLLQRRSAPLNTQGRTDPSLATSPAGLLSSDDLPPGTLDAQLAAELSHQIPQLTTALLGTVAGLPCDQSDAWYATCLVTATTSIFERYVVTPRLAASIWDVLADTPTLVDLGTTTDRMGRAAHAIALPPVPGAASNAVTVLIIDPNTGQLLGTEAVTLSSAELKIDVPTVTGFEVRTDARWVAAIGATL